MLCLHRAAFFLFIGLALSCQERWAKATTESASVLVLNVEQNGRYKEKLTRQLVGFLGLAGNKQIDGKALRPTERRCAEPECLYRLAQHLHADLIVGASVELSKDAGCYLSAWLFDSRNGRDRKAEGPCEVADLEERLMELAGNMVASYQQAPAAGPPRSPPPPPPPPPAQSAQPAAEAPELPVPAGKPDSLSTLTVVSKSRDSGRSAAATGRSALRKGLAGTLGTLAGLSLAAAITLNLLSGTIPPPACPEGKFLNNNCFQNFTGPFATAYAVSGGLVLGTILTLTLPGAR